MTARLRAPLSLPREGPGADAPGAGATLAEFLAAADPYLRWKMLIAACREIHEDE